MTSKQRKAIVRLVHLRKEEQAAERLFFYNLQKLIRLRWPLCRAWRVYLDKKNDYQITKEGVGQYLRSIDFPFSADTLWRSLDSDRSGELSIEEFDLKGAIILARFRAWAVENYQSCHLFYKALRSEVYRITQVFTDDIIPSKMFLWFMLEHGGMTSHFMEVMELQEKYMRMIREGHGAEIEDAELAANLQRLYINVDSSEELMVGTTTAESLLMIGSEMGGGGLRDSSGLGGLRDSSGLGGGGSSACAAFHALGQQSLLASTPVSSPRVWSKTLSNRNDGGGETAACKTNTADSDSAQVAKRRHHFKKTARALIRKYGQTHFDKGFLINFVLALSCQEGPKRALTEADFKWLDGWEPPLYLTAQGFLYLKMVTVLSYYIRLL